jgi:hypothetical protein
MYLSSRARGLPRALHDHEQLELLLESFAKQVEEIVSEVDTTVVCVTCGAMRSSRSSGQHELDTGDCGAHARFWSERTSGLRHQSLDRNVGSRDGCFDCRDVRYECKPILPYCLTYFR